MSVGMSAQNISPVTNKILITDVIITSRPDATPYLGDILIEDGLISRVAADIAQPYDAKVVSGDSMHVYAGFIATASHVGLKAPEEPKDTKVERTGYPPNEIAGITPEMTVAESYSQKESSIKDFRAQGFGIAMTLPQGMMMPGQGSIISLGGGTLNESMIHENVVMYAQWVTADVFPSTLIGIMSKWRELYNNADLTMQHANSYKSNPANRKRPVQDNATEALWPVVSKSMPVFFKAEKLRDITRTLQLKKDLGFDLYITEARDVDRIMSKVQSSGAKVLLSLDLPEAMEEEKTEQDSVKMEPTPLEKAEEKLRMRKSAAIDRYVSQSKMLTESNMPLAFSFLEVKSKDIHDNIKRLIEDGLTHEQSLAALTTTPASILGISNVAGTIEPGKVANLVMTTDTLWAEDAKIKNVMVDGVMHEFDVYTIEIPGMTPKGTMVLTKSGDSYDIVVTSNQSPGEPAEAEDVEIDGSNVSFNFTMSGGPGMSITVENSLDFDGDSFEGTVSVADFGSFDITGQKTSPE